MSVRHLSMSLAGAALALVLVSCEKDEIGSDTSVATTAEAAVATIAGVVDEQAGQAFAFAPTPTRLEKFRDQLLWPVSVQTAWAATCSGRASAGTCTTGKRTKAYDCTFGPNDGFKLKGDVTLTYSQNTCTLGNGDTVTRTLDFTRTGPFGGTLAVSSELHSNYEGTALGGGSTLTVVNAGANTYTVAIGGQRRVLTGPNDYTFYNVSVHTSSPIQIEGGLTRSARVIKTGSAIEVFHNIAKFKSKFEVTEDLTHSASCCYPTAGKISYTNQNASTETGEIQFSGCGKGTITSSAGIQKAFEFSTCE